MITRTGRGWPIGGMPPMAEPGQVVGLAGRRSTDVGCAGHGGEPGDVHPVGPGDQAQQRLERRPRAGTTKTSDFTIWPSSAPSAAAASTAVWVDSSKPSTSSVTPLRAAASRTRWIEGWVGVGHGRSLASGRRRGRRLRA